MHVLANGPRTVRTVFAGLVLLAATLAATLVAPTAAQAAPCHHNECTDRNPQSAGCSSGAYSLEDFVAYDGQIPYLHVELRFSPTCSAVWTRATPLVDGRAGPLWNYVVLARYTNRTGGTANWMRVIAQPLTAGVSAWTVMHGFDNRWFAACVSDSNSSVNGPCTPRR